MLGGLAPVLIFQFPAIPNTPLFNAISGIPVFGEDLANAIGIPIPIYLDERLTGIYIESETKALDIDTQTEARNDGEKPTVTQITLNNVITVNMIAKRDNVLLSALLALNDIIFTKVVQQSYSLSYLNGPTVVFGGLLQSFTSSSGSDDDLMRISMQISKANQKSTAEKAKTLTVPKLIGDFPPASAVGSATPV